MKKWITLALAVIMMITLSGLAFGQERISKPSRKTADKGKVVKTDDRSDVKRPEKKADDYRRVTGMKRRGGAETVKKGVKGRGSKNVKGKVGPKKGKGHGAKKGTHGHGGNKGVNGHGGPKGKNGHGGNKGVNGHGGDKGVNGFGGPRGKNGRGRGKGRIGTADKNDEKEAAKKKTGDQDEDEKSAPPRRGRRARGGTEPAKGTPVRKGRGA